MDRSLYPEGVEVHQRDLEFTESSKAAAIIKRAGHLSKYGVTSGLGVSVNTTDNTRIDIAAGGGYTASGEYVEVAASQLAVQLSSYTNATKNYVLVMYDEAKSQPESHESDGTTQNTKATVSPRVVVLTEAAYNALPASNAVLSQNAKDRALVVAIVTANGSGVALTSGSIVSPTTFDAVMYTSQPLNITGVTIIRVDSTTVSGTASLDYLTGTKQIRWQAPGESYGSYVTLTVSGSYTLLSSSGKSATIQVSFTQLPTANATDSIVVTDLYAQNVPRFSAADTHHRSMVGSGQPNANNPHGLTVDDLSPGAAGTLEEHQDVQHVKGIPPTASTALLKCSINTGSAPDSVSVVNFSSGDLCYINGKRIQALATSNTVTFSDGVVDPATYAIVMSQDGALSKSIRARFPSGALLSNKLQIMNVSDGIATTSKSITWESTGWLSFDGGVKVQGTVTNDKIYRLISSDCVNYVDVLVKASSTPGSTQTDSIAFTALPSQETNLLLAYVVWSGSASGFLGAGFGGSNAPNIVYDRREFGNTAQSNMSTSAGYTNVKNMLGNTVNPILIVPRAVDNNDYSLMVTESFSLGLASGLTATLTGGRIIYSSIETEVPTTTLNFSDNQANLVYLDMNGALQTVAYVDTAPAEATARATVSNANLNKVAFLYEVVFSGGVETGRSDLTQTYRYTSVHDAKFGVVGLTADRSAVITATRGAALTATGGSSNGNGVTATGWDAGSGINATGGNSNGTGVVATGGGASGSGMSATAAGTGDGLVANATSGRAVLATATTGTAVRAVSSGSGLAIVGLGGTVLGGKTDDIALEATSGGNAPAIEAWRGDGSNTGPVIEAHGSINMAGGDSLSTTGFANQLTKENVVKAWADVSASTTPSVLDGFNVASVSYAAGPARITVNFATAMANANYAVSLTNGGSGVDPFLWYVYSKAAGSIVVAAKDVSAGGAQASMGASVRFQIIIIGRQ